MKYARKRNVILVLLFAALLAAVVGCTGQESDTEEHPDTVKEFTGEVLSYEETDEGLTFTMDVDYAGIKDSTRTFLLTDESAFDTEELQKAVRNQQIGIYLYVFSEYNSETYEGVYPVGIISYYGTCDSVKRDSVRGQLGGGKVDKGRNTMLRVTGNGFEKEESAKTLYDLLDASNWTEEKTSAPADAKDGDEPLFTILFEEGYGLQVSQDYVCAYDERVQPLGLLHEAYITLPKGAAESVAAYVAENSGTSDEG